MTLATTLPDRLLHFIRGPKMRAWAASKGARTDALEAAVAAVMQSFDLATATGDRLDKLGSILQLPRQGQLDDRYRLLLQIQVVLILASQGTTETMLEVVRLFTGREAPTYTEFHPARIDISALLDDVADADALRGLLRQAKPGGVALNVSTAAAESALVLDDVSSIEFLASRPEVRFCSNSIDEPNDWSALAVDLSSHGVDLTANADDAAAEPHAPTTGLTGDRCVEALVTMNDGIGQFMVMQRNPAGGLFADAAWHIGWDNAGQVLRIGHAGLFTALNLTIPNVGATQRPYYVAWSEAANPNTTGASDARLSHFRVWDLTTGEYAETSGAHAVTPNSGGRLIVGSGFPGGGQRWDLDGNTLSFIRISDRPRSRQEIEGYLDGLLANLSAIPNASERVLDDVTDPLPNAGTLADVEPI